MNWLVDYENLTARDQELFQKCTNTLLGQTYLVAKREKDIVLYRYCERKYELIRDYLQLSGWQLHHVKKHGFIYVKNQFDNSRRKFTLSETLFLFITRLLHDEKMKELNLTQKVMINNRDILEKYNALNIKERMPAREEYRRTLKLFQSYSLLELKDFKGAKLGMLQTVGVTDDDFRNLMIGIASMECGDSMQLRG